MIELCAPTRVAVAERLRRAESLRELEAAAQDIQHVASIGDRNDLARVFKTKADELKRK